MVSVISAPVTIPSLGVAVIVPFATVATVNVCGNPSNSAVTVTSKAGIIITPFEIPTVTLSSPVL